MCACRCDCAALALFAGLRGCNQSRRVRRACRWRPARRPCWWTMRRRAPLCNGNAPHARWSFRTVRGPSLSDPACSPACSDSEASTTEIEGPQAKRGHRRSKAGVSVSGHRASVGEQPGSPDERSQATLPLSPLSLPLPLYVPLALSRANGLLSQTRSDGPSELEFMALPVLHATDRCN